MGDQFTNGGLPDKEWYELEEVAECWSKMTASEVSVKDILHYGQTGKLDICFRPCTATLELLCLPWRISDEKSPGGQNKVLEHAVTRQALAKVSEGILDTIISDGKRTSKSLHVEKFYGVNPFLLDLGESINNEILSRQSPYLDPDTNNNFIIYAMLRNPLHSNKPITIRIKDLLIPTEELERFEKEHGIGQPRQGMPSSTESSGSWPWGSHETELLRHLAAAAKHLWVLYDPDDPSTAPTNEQVSNFLVDRGVPKSMSDKMATILRPETLKSGRRKR